MTNVNLRLLLAKIIERVSPNFDGGGFKVYIEESQIKFEELW